MLRRIVNSQAGIFVPSANDARFPHAFTSVSWTRSSARSGLPQSDTAKARRLGMAPIRSDFSFVLAAIDCRSPSVVTGFRLEPSQKLDKAGGDRLVQYI